jgi:hypothetical protein
VFSFINIVGARTGPGQIERNLQDMEVKPTADMALKYKGTIVGIKRAHFNGGREPAQAAPGAGGTGEASCGIGTCLSREGAYTDSQGATRLRTSDPCRGGGALSRPAPCELRSPCERTDHKYRPYTRSSLSTSGDKRRSARPVRAVGHHQELGRPAALLDSR